MSSAESALYFLPMMWIVDLHGEIQKAVNQSSLFKTNQPALKGSSEDSTEGVKMGKWVQGQESVGISFSH